MAMSRLALERGEPFRVDSQPCQTRLSAPNGPQPVCNRKKLPSNRF